MTTFTNSTITWFVTSQVYGAISDGMAAVAVALLLILLTEKVLLEARKSRSDKNKTHALNIVIWPLLFVLGTAIFLRAAQILRLW